MLPISIPCLVNPPCKLRAFEPRDADIIASAADDPLIPLITTVPTTGSPADVDAYIQRQHERLTSGAGYSFAIADFETDEAVGQIGLWLHEISTGRASTGYWVASSFRRRGYARAALQALTAWAVELDEVERLHLFVEPWNAGSWRAAEACGFEREGLLHAWEQVGDERKDMYVYSVVLADRRSP
ncbi:MAG: GNAT family protein [Aeromicrobium sp.]